MSFKDIFKNTFLEGFSNGIGIKTIIIGMGITTLLALYVFFLYKLITRKTFYSATFNLSLVAMPIITAAVILTIQSNVVLSLGMVGALSIVRFRTAIKDPLDLVFLYWSISIGIICGAGLSAIAIVLAFVMTVIIVILQKQPLRRKSMILIVNSTSINSDRLILDEVKQHSKICKVKTKNLTPSSLDMIIEIKVDEDSDLVHQILKIEGVTSASILSHDGEITA